MKPSQPNTELVPHKSHDTDEKILQDTTRLVALYGCEGISMRRVGQAVPIVQSVIYHYYPNKDQLLKAMYERANHLLGQSRANLPVSKTAVDKLRQLVIFQIDHAELIIAVLKYYLAYRDQFAQEGSGTLPEKATLHVEEVLKFGQKTGEWRVSDVAAQSKVIAHAINGYLLEYYPHLPTGQIKKDLVDAIVQFTNSAFSSRSKA